MPDQMLHPSSIRDPYVLTRLVERGPGDEEQVYDVSFAPLVQTMSRKVRLAIVKYNPSGLASFKADNANTPTVNVGGEVREEYMELVTISEKFPLTASDLIALQSPDTRVAETAARDIVKLGQTLRARNVQRTKWMAWQAVRDELVIEYPDGAQIQIDYDLDGDNQNDDFSGSHTPTVSTAWSDTGADIIGDIEDWCELIADDLGADPSECTLHVNSKVWGYMKKNTGIKAELSDATPRIITPTRTEVPTILGIGQVVIDNTFWKSTADVKTKFLPDDNVLLTAPYTWEGAPLIEMMDGPVVRVVGNDLVVEQNPGALAEIYISAEQQTKNIRVSTARIPVMNHPGGIVWADISGS